MESFRFFLVFCFIFGTAVNFGEAMGGMDMSFLRGAPNMGGYRATPHGYGQRSSGSRGLIARDLAWIGMLPLTIIETLINIPVVILENVANLTNTALRYFLSAEVVDVLETLVEILLFPLYAIWWVISIPCRIVWFFITLPFKVVGWILSLFFGFDDYSYQVKIVNRFLKGDIFGPLGKGIEELLIDIYNTIISGYDWLFSSPREVDAKRSVFLNTLSDTLVHLGDTNRMLKGSKP